MKKVKQLIKSTTLAMAMVMGVSTVAMAVIAHPQGGTWNYGLKDPHNGYYMAYSYYYHGSNAHRSSCSLNGILKRSENTAPGYTSIANSESLQSTDAHYWYKNL